MAERTRSCESPEEVMSAIADSDCREILVATAEEPQTVSELVEECEIPTATAYRKVERLVGANLLDERIRVKPRGRNSCEYLLCAEAIRVEIPEENPTVTVSCSFRARDSSKAPLVELSTDGGRPTERSDPKRKHRFGQAADSDAKSTPDPETTAQSASLRERDSRSERAVQIYARPPETPTTDERDGDSE